MQVNVVVPPTPEAEITLKVTPQEFEDIRVALGLCGIDKFTPRFRKSCTSLSKLMWDVRCKYTPHLT